MWTVIRSVVAASLMFMTFAATSVRADSYDLDPSHAAFVFSIQHMEFSQTIGWFGEMSGTFTTGESPSFDITIKADSINTNSEKRDEHLRGPDFFNTKQFPVITFKSTHVEVSGDQVEVTGDFTLHGVTKPLTVVLTKNGEGKDPMGSYRAGYSTKLSIQRTDFGMGYGVGMVGDQVDIIVSFEGVRK